VICLAPIRTAPVARGRASFAAAPFVKAIACLAPARAPFWCTARVPPTAETLACAWLSATALVGVGLNAAFGWWWADPAAALLLVPLIVDEAREAFESDDDDDD
jgi:hypothetical protein